MARAYHGRNLRRNIATPTFLVGDVNREGFRTLDNARTPDTGSRVRSEAGVCDTRWPLRPHTMALSYTAGRGRFTAPTPSP